MFTLTDVSNIGAHEHQRVTRIDPVRARRYASRWQRVIDIASTARNSRYTGSKNGQAEEEHNLGLDRTKPKVSRC
jgi:hypothetical protein